ncbi:MAG: hypothetical protein Q4P17_07620 [Methanobacterium sp.]|nr:hypothetical protein [Methanobacterium sp.]
MNQLLSIQNLMGDAFVLKSDCKLNYGVELKTKDGDVITHAIVDDSPILECLNNSLIGINSKRLLYYDDLINVHPTSSDAIFNIISSQKNWICECIEKWKREGKPKWKN